MGCFAKLTPDPSFCNTITVNLITFVQNVYLLYELQIILL